MAHLLEKLPGNGVLDHARSYLPPLNFITIHYIYFVGTCLLTSIIFYCTSTPAFSITYTDSLYLVISAMTEAGLNTVNLSQMNTFQQWLLFMHILGGSAVFVSIFVVLVRKRAFNKRFGTILKIQREQMRKRRTSSRGSHRRPLPHVTTPDKNGHLPQQPERPWIIQSAPNDTAIEAISTGIESGRMGGEVIQPLEHELQDQPKDNGLSSPTQSLMEHISFVPGTSFKHSELNSQRLRNSGMFSFTGVGASPLTTSFWRPGQPVVEETATTGAEQDQPTNSESQLPQYRPNFLTRGVVGRNSQFHGLTHEEREQLGGVEYRAITLLSWVVPIYFELWQFLGSLSLGAWMAYNAADVTSLNGINPWWNGAFNAVSAFNNSGMSLLDANMIPFQTSTFPVFTMGILILAGNTAYPVFLRLILWTMYRLIPEKPYYDDWRDTLRFTLGHPRRVYTNLFPSAQTWWLLLTLIILNGTDWIAFELLNLGNDVITSIPSNSRVLDGLFQALAVRSGGFYIVPIPSIRIGVQVLYVLMMYISAYPVVITMRNSNVYEERSLGIYTDDSIGQRKDPENGKISRLKRSMTFKPDGETRGYFIRQQMRGQLAHDLSWLAIAVLLIVCIEVGSFDRNPITFSVFNVVFEVVSGYGCVGITTGLPDQSYSFSGSWHIMSKLILCAVMLRGRHRGLPVAIDRAVMIPGDRLTSKEEEDHEIRRGRSMHREPQQYIT